jgi:hypothetical protein
VLAIPSPSRPLTSASRSSPPSTPTPQDVSERHSYRYSVEYLGHLAAIEGAYVTVAEADGDVAGAYLFFETDGIIQMHLGGPRTAYMRPSPSHLLIRSVVLWGRGRGDAIAHLGGGLGGAVDDSLFAFKAGFSPRRHAYSTLPLVADRDRYDALTLERAELPAVPQRS